MTPTVRAGPSKPTVLCFRWTDIHICWARQDVYAHFRRTSQVSRRRGRRCSQPRSRSIFPGIFQRDKVQDVVQLQVMLFAMQYASARSWIDAGVRPAAVVGHSFGEITALCVSSILSLEDTVKIIVARATVVRDGWGSDKGAMMAVEGELGDIEKLLAEASNLCSADTATRGHR